MLKMIACRYLSNPFFHIVLGRNAHRVVAYFIFPLVEKARGTHVSYESGGVQNTNHLMRGHHGQIQGILKYLS